MRPQQLCRYCTYSCMAVRFAVLDQFYSSGMGIIYHRWPARASTNCVALSVEYKSASRETYIDNMPWLAKVSNNTITKGALMALDLHPQNWWKHNQHFKISFSTNTTQVRNYLLAVICEINTQIHEIIEAEACLIDDSLQHLLVDLIWDVPKHNLLLFE